MDIRLELKAKNLKLWKACELAGGARQLADQAGVSYGDFLKILTFRLSPLRFVKLSGNRYCTKWRHIATRLAAHLGELTEDLFPQHLYPEPGRTRSGVYAIEIDSLRCLPLSEVRGLLAPSPDEQIANDKRAEVVARILDTLPPREARMVKMRFGFCEEAKTLAEAGAAYGISRERARQIEQVALRKLRHPSRSWALKGVLDF
jgi:RNA polymerase sigma factor (sigma-70 family)